MKHKEKRDLYRSGKSDEPLEDQEKNQKKKHIKKGKGSTDSEGKKDTSK